MYVKFPFTLDDLVDAHKRILARRSKGNLSVRSAAWQSAIALGVLVVLLLRDDLLVGLVVGVCLAGVIVRYYPRWQEKSVENTIRRMGADIMAAHPAPHICEVELKADGVWVRELNTQTLYEWSSVETVAETPDSIDLFTRVGSGIVVRNRAFATDDERTHFLKIARANLAKIPGRPSSQAG